MDLQKNGMQARMAEGFFIHILSKTISRVMSLNGHLSRPAVASRLKRPTRKQTGRLMLPVRSCFEWGLHGPLLLPEERWSLTPPFHPYRRCGGLFLLHFPWSHLRQTLSGILPCEARTFLTCSLSALQLRPFVLLKTI